MWDWREYIRVAERLKPKAFASEVEIARARCSISRAYYAALNVARDYVVEKQYVGGRPSSHEVLWNLLDESSRSREERKAAAEGRKLRTMRNNADYDNPILTKKLQENCDSALIATYKVCEFLGKPFPQPESAAQAKAPPPPK